MVPRRRLLRHGRLRLLGQLQRRRGAAVVAEPACAGDHRRLGAGALDRAGLRDPARARRRHQHQLHRLRPRSALATQQLGDADREGVHGTCARDDDHEGAKAEDREDNSKFKFKSSEPGSDFQCKLDKGKFKLCASPAKYTKLDPGKHKFTGDRGRRRRQCRHDAGEGEVEGARLTDSTSSSSGPPASPVARSPRTWPSGPPVRGALGGGRRATPRSSSGCWARSASPRRRRSSRT